jgi:TRAP transporter TAXI family solute receptor
MLSSTALKTVVLPVIITLLAFFFAYQFVDPPPPREVVFTTGDPDGAYAKYAGQFKSYLEQYDITLTLRESQGSVENVSRLASGAATVGFVQGGTVAEDQGSDLQTLGSLYYEPLWVFHRAGEQFGSLTDMAGKTLDIGKQGSGTRALVMHLLSENNLEDKIGLYDSDSLAPASLLKSGQVDVVFLVAAPTSGQIRELLADEAIGLMSFTRVKAYQRIMKFLNHVTLPRGMVDLEHDIPVEDKVLLASTANLVVHKDLHPAIQDLLLQASTEIFNRGGWFENHGEFPNVKFAELMVSPEAKRFYKYGPPLLQRYLPFRLASLIDRLKVMILPLVVLMIPLMKIMPPIYTWRMRSKIYRWYQKLEKIDLANARPDPDLAFLEQQLNEIEHEVIHVHVPPSFASQLYDLHQHIELVKRRLTNS